MRPRPLRSLSLPLTITVLCWGFNFVALKLAYRELSVPALALSRFLITWAVMAAVCLVQGERLRVAKADALRMFGMGFVASGVYMVVFLVGMGRTTAAEGAIILNTSPVFVMLMSAAVGHERFRWGTLFGAFVALSGVAMVAIAGATAVHGDLVGNLIVLCSSALWAWGVVLARPLLEKYSPVRVLTLSMAGAAVVMVPFGLQGVLETDWTSVSLTTYLALGHISLLAGALSFTSFYAGVRQVGGTGAMLYQYSVPPLAALFAWFTLGQGLHWQQFVGMIVVIAGVSWAWRSRSADVQQEPVPAEG
jgi:drug/metabolite transporter (DMT)-like permease